MPIGGNNPYYPPGIMSPPGYDTPRTHQQSSSTWSSSQSSRGAEGWSLSGTRPPPYLEQRPSTTYPPNYDSSITRRDTTLPKFPPSYTTEPNILTKPDTGLSRSKYDKAVKETAHTEGTYKALEKITHENRNVIHPNDTFSARGALEKLHNAQASGFREGVSGFFGGNSLRTKLKKDANREIATLSDKATSYYAKTQPGDRDFIPAYSVQSELDRLKKKGV